MPTFTIRTPSGRTYRIEAPSQEAAIRGAQEQERQRGGSRSAGDRALGAARSAAQGVLEGVRGAIELTPFARVSNSLQDIGQRLSGATGDQRWRSGANALAQVANPMETAAAAVPHYQPVGAVERNLERGGRLSTNALAPGSAVQRSLSVLAPYVLGALGHRVDGQRGEMIGEVLGGFLGGGVGRHPEGASPTAADTAARVLRNRGGARAADTAAMRTRAAEFEAQDIRPTAADLTSPRGRRVIRAAASATDEGQAAAETFRTSRTLNLPGRMSRQARTAISNDPRTPDAIRRDTAKARTAQADADFRAVRNEPITMAPETVTALRSDYGRAAIAEAARRERDPDVRAALNRLATAALDDPSTPITVGMADRISRVLLGRARQVARSGDNDLATTLGDLGRNIRRPAAASVPGYQTALTNYGAGTRLNEAAAVGESFLGRNTDEFTQALANMSNDELALARAAARRAVERASGENVSAAPGVARAIASAPEQQARNAALLGPEGAADLQARMGSEAQLVRNAAEVDPGTGSQTFMNLQTNNNLQTAGDIARQAGQFAMGGTQSRISAVVNAATLAAQRFGLKPHDAEEFALSALDPEQTQSIIEAIDRLTARPGAGLQFVQVVTRPAAALTFNAAVGGGQPAQQ